MNKRIVNWLLVGLVVIGIAAYARSMMMTDSRPYVTPTVDLILAGPDAFYDLITAGAESAAERYDVNLRVHRPDGTGPGQTDALHQIDLATSNGVAVSPLAPDEQRTIINRLASKVPLVTYDNDLPDSLRMCYIGTNNWTGGQLSADLVRRTLPEGGRIALFIGDNVRQNARHRRQAFMAALKYERPNPDADNWNLTDSLEVGNYTLVRCYLDDSNPEQARANAAQAIKDYPDLDCMVGLYGYSAPACLKALQEAGKVGEIKVVAFDEHAETLDGIAAGHIFGTVVQDPFQFGFDAVRILADINRTPDRADPLPGSGSVYLPCSIVTAAELESFRTKLEKRSAPAPETTPTG